MSTFNCAGGNMSKNSSGQKPCTTHGTKPSTKRDYSNGGNRRTTGSTPSNPPTKPTAK